MAARKNNDNGGFRFRILLSAFLLQNAYMAIQRSNKEVAGLARQATEFGTIAAVMANDTEDTKKADKKLKIAVVSNFVHKDTNATTRPRIGKNYVENHLLNKACYSHIWNYDFIFNSTWGLEPHERSIEDEEKKGAWWLDFGMWNRIPHVLEALDQGYDWVLYADTDYVFQDMTTPIESFIKEWEMNGLHNVHVFVPDDDQPQQYVFSSFATLFRNSDFSRSVLNNWRKFGKGLCRNGNFPGEPGEYTWYFGDQPGLWYALAKAHSDMYYKGTDKEYHHKCNETSGYLDVGFYMHGDLTNYMWNIGAVKDNDLSKLPKDQPIVWSNTQDGKRGGLGVQQNWGDWEKRDDSHAYAIHKKEDLPESVMADLDHCRKHYGCVSKESEKDGHLDIHCGKDGEPKTGQVINFVPKKETKKLHSKKVKPHEAKNGTPSIEKVTE